MISARLWVPVLAASGATAVATGLVLLVQRLPMGFAAIPTLVFDAVPIVLAATGAALLNLFMLRSVDPLSIAMVKCGVAAIAWLVAYATLSAAVVFSVFGPAYISLVLITHWWTPLVYVGVAVAVIRLHSASRSSQTVPPGGS